jgi:ABC-type multidrug transport system fused ATPase/permease subunit
MGPARAPGGGAAASVTPFRPRGAPSAARPASTLTRTLRVLRVLVRVAAAFLPFWPWVAGLVVATVAGISAELVEPLLHQAFVNRVLLGHEIGLLPEILGLYAAAAAAQWLAGTAVAFTFLQSTERFSVRLRVAAYAHLRTLGLRQLRTVSTGEATAALQQFGPEVGEGILAVFQALLASLYRLPASLILLARLNGPLLRWTLPLLCIYPLYPVLTSGPLRRALTRLAIFDVWSQGVVNDRVAGLRTLLHRVDSRPDVDALFGVLWRRVRLRMRAFYVDRAGGLADIVAHQGLTVVLLGAGGMAVLHGQMTVGALLAYLEYVRGVEGPVRRLMHLPIQAQRAAVVAERVFWLLDAPADVRAPRHGVRAELRGEVEFRGVTVRSDDGRAILTDVSFRIPAGAVCAVVGGSGAGKSTLGALVPRYLDPDAGTVLLDGRDARTYDLASLRAAVAVAPQDPVFLRESVVENVRLGRPGATDAEVRAAMTRARIDDVAARTLQEGAGNLSGGQRQRLALARVYLQDPAVLVLDEATTGLDPALQRRILADLMGLRGRRTVILITHQMDVAGCADLVAVLQDGHLQRFGVPSAVLRGGA